MIEREDTPPDLEFRTRVPGDAREGGLLLVLLHGRGSDERDLLGLGSILPHGALLVTPRAPFSAAEWGYGPGWAWYRYVAEDRVVTDTLERSLDALDRLMDRLPDELPVRPGKIVIGGFSQGGTTSLAWALTRPGRASAVVNFSGFLVAHPKVTAAGESAHDLRVFWGHGVRDTNIPYDLGERGRRTLAGWGARLEAFDHPGGHTIVPDEMHALQDWLEEIGRD